MSEVVKLRSTMSSEDLPADVVLPMTDDEFRRNIAYERMFLGARSELLVGADCFHRGYIVSRPLADGSRYDLVVDRGVDLLRVQVKTAAKTQLIAQIGWTSWKVRDGQEVETHFRQYVGTEFDFLAVVDRTQGDVYYVPSSDIDFEKATFYIREADRERYKEF